MSAAFSFGSLGDIIAICQLAYEFARALHDSTGSAKEYQELREDVDGSTQLLLQLMATCEEDSSGLLQDIDNLTKSAITDCATTLREALDRFEKYDISLRSGGSGNRLKDAFGKLKWLGEKENVERIQQKLRAGTERVNMLLSAASRVSARQNCRTVVSRIDVVFDLLSEQLNDQKVTVTQLEAKLQNSHDDISCRLTTIESSLDGQEETMRRSLEYAKSGLSATRCLQQIFTQMFQSILNFQSGAVLNQTGSDKGTTSDSRRCAGKRTRSAFGLA
ncbi:hypothetical protein GE09DRAFT_154848 [Coniochaeta sp. 2T2.1]|nr:hypothetical protein GE09DRAFT_154848 [Coniochaeta sp. 2T2.1]